MKLEMLETKRSPTGLDSNDESEELSTDDDDNSDDNIVESP